MPSRPKVALPNVETSPASAWTSETAAPQVAPWTKPALNVYGDVRQLTMGLSVPPGESGNAGTRHN